MLRLRAMTETLVKTENLHIKFVGSKFLTALSLTTKKPENSTSEPKCEVNTLNYILSLYNNSLSILADDLQIAHA